MTDLMKSVFYRLFAFISIPMYKCLQRNIHIQTSFNNMISPSSEINVSNNGFLKIGKQFAILRDATLICRKSGEIIIGDKVTIGIRNYINCHEKICIGNNVNLAQDVKIYDHDHDFTHYRMETDDWKYNFITTPVIIGSNVWIGAGVIILRGTEIGDNCVIGAGAVIKGKYPSNSVIIQKRCEIIKKIDSVK